MNFMSKFYLTLANDDVEFWIPVGYVWTEHTNDDLHVQFDGPGGDNFCPRRDSHDHFIVTFEGRQYTCRHLGFIGTQPATGRRLHQWELEQFWISPNR